MPDTGKTPLVNNNSYNIDKGLDEGIILDTVKCYLVHYTEKQ